MRQQIKRSKSQKMINKPKNLGNKELSLVKETIRLVFKDQKITDREMDYIKRLYWVIFDTEASKQTMINDLTELGGWQIKDVSK